MAVDSTQSTLVVVQYKKRLVNRAYCLMLTRNTVDPKTKKVNLQFSCARMFTQFWDFSSGKNKIVVCNYYKNFLTRLHSNMTDQFLYCDIINNFVEQNNAGLLGISNNTYSCLLL